jgi:hypothetical protein
MAATTSIMEFEYFFELAEPHHAARSALSREHRSGDIAVLSVSHGSHLVPRPHLNWV